MDTGEEGHRGKVPSSSVKINADHLVEVVGICQVSPLRACTFPLLHIALFGSHEELSLLTVGCSPSSRAVYTKFGGYFSIGDLSIICLRIKTLR